MATEDTRMHDVTTTLRSELAALQYKRDRLLSEHQELKGQLRTKDERVIELNNECEQLKEQSARQNSIIASLKTRIQELEDRERSLNNALHRSEMTVETITRENRYQIERVKELELKSSHLECEKSEEESHKRSIEKQLSDFVKKLAIALGSETRDVVGIENITRRASELIQDVSLLRSRSTGLADSLTRTESELRDLRDSLEKAILERDSLQRRGSSHYLEMEKLKQEKETLEIKLRTTENELTEIKEKYTAMGRTLSNAHNDITTQESIIFSLKEEIKQKDEKINDLESSRTNLLGSLAVSLSSPARFIEPHASAVKEQVREIVRRSKEQALEIEELHEKWNSLSHKNTDDKKKILQDQTKIRNLEEERSLLEMRLHKTESELTSCEVIKEGLKRDKTIFVTFLERLSRALNMDELSKEIGVDLHTESILIRAEQLAKLESGKLVDKSAVVYQLQRRLRTLRDQLQRRDLHLDLLRKKLSLQEDNSRARSMLEAEKEEANIKIKKMQRQMDKLQCQLTEARATSRDLRTQLNEAEEYKAKAIERSHKIEELQKRLLDSEMLRTRYLNKFNALKEQLNNTTESADHERSMNEHSIKILKDELGMVKQTLMDCQRNHTLLSDLRRSVANILGLELSCTDYEIISKLSKLATAHREFTLVSRRYDDPVGIPSTPVGQYPALEYGLTSRFPAVDRNRYVDNILDDIDDDINAVYNKRPSKNIT